MRDETKIVLSSLNGREKYDEACKKAWMLKEIIAPVLRYTIREYQSYSVPEVIKFINADTITDNVPVDDLPALIDSSNTELSSPTEKRVFFDIHFTAKNPNLSTKDVLVMLHIDFEVQNDYEPTNPSYPIVKRAIYYAARELSAQLGVVSKSTNYDKLEKVYSIWICNERIPAARKNSITRYHIEKEDIMGQCDENDAYHDLMEVMIVCRGAEPVENTLFEYLNGVFKTDFAVINKYVDVENNSEVKEVLKTMSGLGKSLENKGFDKGFDKGKLVQLIELVVSGDLTVERASEKAGMAVEAFKKTMQETITA